MEPFYIGTSKVEMVQRSAARLVINDFLQTSSLNRMIKVPSGKRRARANVQ